VPEAAPPAPKPRQVEAAPRPAPAKERPVEAKTDTYITRREFLNYAWLASIALFSLETVALSLWFAFPIFKPGQFGGEFPIGDAASALPEVNAPPKPYTDGKFWLVNLDTQAANGEPRKGIMAIYKVCTHLGCLYDWQSVTSRFECPCHGSKFTLAADYIAGPARRSLDRFVIKAIGADGAVVAQTNEQGAPLELPSEDVQLVVDTGQRIFGAPVVTPA
jgi:cytochrome b6-f complex iron-sulfur subunit